MDKHYGCCVDGHLHQIQPDYVNIALQNNERFKSTMFLLSQDESKIPDEAFIPLPPTNCPSIAAQLPFDRFLRKNKVSEERKIAPFRVDVTDQRTPIAFLYSFEAHSDRYSETEVEGIEKLYALIKRACPTLTASQVEEMSYESLRQTFLRQFWSMEHQREEYSRFFRSKYPMHRNQKVSEYVYYWLDRLTFNTIYLTRDIVKDLMAKIPQPYERHLKVFLKGAKMYDVYQVVYEVENNIQPAGEDGGEQSDTLTDYWTYLIFVASTSAMIAVFGAGFYCYYSYYSYYS